MKKTIQYQDYYDKVLGGWIGKCAGGILGAPIEGFKKFNTIPYSDELFATNFANDDLDLQVLWLDMLLQKGDKVREADFNSHWMRHVDFPWCEYGIALRNMRMGLDNPNTGEHNNWYWNSGMGSPIRSEIWGMVNPGHPEKAVFYAGIDSRLDHHGFSVHAEQYLSACASLAFFESDVKTILSQGLQYIPSDSDCHILVHRIMEWNKQFDFDIVAGKIKSYYGDADFTAAAMNVGFILLSLLHADNSFDFLIDALHMGHDSDCVVATAGGLLGIILGYKAIPEVWKKRVGDELLVSPEITGIYCPKTITELSELTCKAGIHFASATDSIRIVDFPSEAIFVPPYKDYAIHTEVISFPNPATKKNASITIHYENQEDSPQKVQLAISSPYFKRIETSLSVSPISKLSWEVLLEFNDKPFPKSYTKIPYTLHVKVDDKKSSILEKGMPYYGEWLLLGPFIEDDPSLVPLDTKYPDHGLPSLPSCAYMNHDLARPEKEFVSVKTVERLLAEKCIFKQPFHAEIVHPDAMKMNLKDYFYGNGERTLYLYSEVHTDHAAKKWLALGSSTYVKVWHNGEKVYHNDALKRSWPLAHTVELFLAKGKNSFLIRMDVTLDNFELEIGLKEHNEKHAHQSQWESNLQFTLDKSL
ncbi:ADP-ribosylglycohydrolase family protein [Ulvibacterium sp.]|uniref:ADP-ribosylglycohydrolase family protein n=1 Tax=Ulvibacterium sp. TaxID=2665914 RepID=UPI002621FB7D|nr:ADP-ribosylglycohydrolase family protein [Ulvibacterium sp.]